MNKNQVTLRKTEKEKNLLYFQSNVCALTIIKNSRRDKNVFTFYLILKMPKQILATILRQNRLCYK